MSYKQFSLRAVEKQFSLNEASVDFFGETLKPLPMSPWLQQALAIGLKVALASANEKAKSEFIVAPIFFELLMRNQERIAVYSGENLDADESQGLNGECDFIVAKGAIRHTLQTPIFTLVETKKDDIGEGLGQCAAQMVGARLFNQQEGHALTAIFGCVTTGAEWQFLKLEGATLYIDSERYFINQVERILSALQMIVDLYVTP